MVTTIKTTATAPMPASGSIGTAGMEALHSVNGASENGVHSAARNRKMTLGFGLPGLMAALFTLIPPGSASAELVSYTVRRCTADTLNLYSFNQNDRVRVFAYDEKHLHPNSSEVVAKMTCLADSGGYCQLEIYSYGENTRTPLHPRSGGHYSVYDGYSTEGLQNDPMNGDKRQSLCR